MAYAKEDFPTKTALKKAVSQNPLQVEVFQPNADITGHHFKDGEIIVIEGPHYPKPHRWYARAKIKLKPIMDFNPNNIVATGEKFVIEKIIG